MVVRRAETVQDVFSAFGVEDNEEDAPVFADRHAFTPASDGEEPPEGQGAAGDEPAPATEPKRSMPAGSVALSRSYEVKGIRFDSIQIEPPRGVDFWSRGDIIEWQVMRDGSPYRVLRDDVIRSYAEVCVRPDRRLTGADVLDALNLADTMAVRKAVIGFFTKAEGGSA